MTQEKNDKREVFTQIEIAAPREKVWAVLTDFERMPEWSSSFQGIKGDFREGGKATSRFKAPLGKKNMEFEHTIIEFEEGVSFGWSDPLMMGMSDHHLYRLEELPNGNTLFIQTDGVEGGATHFMGRLVTHNMKSMYLTFNQELKARVESLS
ncbi:MAG: SRPBCC domain-containing protein [Bacteroidota bacterium]